MTTALTEQLSTPKTAMTFGEFQTLRQQAEVMIASKFLPRTLNTPEKVISVAMAGRELGIGFMASLRNIYPIDGVPTIAPRLMLALAIKTGELEDWSVERTETHIKITIKRAGKTPHVEVFGDAQAKSLGLLNKDNYVKQKLTMYKWRALSAALNFMFPDVLMGMYTPEELGAQVVVDDQDDLNVKGLIVTTSDNGTVKDQAESAKVKASEIIAALAQLHNGETEDMADHLAELTRYDHHDEVANVTVKRWVELDDLPELAVTKPAWVDRIYEKVIPELKKQLEAKS